MDTSQCMLIEPRIFFAKKNPLEFYFKTRNHFRDEITRFVTAICFRAWMNSLSWEHHPCLGPSKVSNVSDSMNYVSDNMNYLTTHGILHHVLENQSFITSHLCLYYPINFMVFRSKEHHVSQHMVIVSQSMVKYAMCGEEVHVV